MTRPATVDLRRESIDMLGVGGSFNEKHTTTDFVDEDQGKSLPMRRLDHDSKKTGEFIQQNGHRDKDYKRNERFVEKRWWLYPEKYRKMQNYCFRFLEMPRGFVSYSYHALLFLLVIVSLVLTVLSTVNTEDMKFEVILHIPILVVEIILIIIFVVEYIVRIWAAGCRSAYVGLKGRLRFGVQIYSIIDMAVIISSILVVSLSSNMSSSPIRLLPFLPLLRVLRFDRQGGTWKLLGSVIYVHRQELLTTFYLGFISLIFASFVLYMAEGSNSERDFENWPSSFWWGIVTLTTVGYGDTVPKTWYGKMCAAVFALCGISFFALPAGILGSGFALKVTQQQRQKHFHRRRRPAAILLQSYWRLYCADLNSKSVATWLPSIYYNRQQHLLKSVMEKTGTTGTAFGENSPELDSRKRKRSLWSSKPQKGLRRGSLDVLSSKSDSNFSSNMKRDSSTCSALVDSDFFDENALLAFQQDGETPCIELSKAQKLAIRLIRILKLRVAIRKFKEARRPYDVKDVIEQYSTGHVEMLARVKNLQAKIDKALGKRVDNGDDESAGKMGLSSRLIRVEQQVNLMDSKLETVLQILQNMQNTRSYPSGGSNSYDLFRGNGDGVSSRRSSVSRANSDPLDVRTQIGNNGVTTSVSRTSDIPCVTLSDPESVLSSLSECDRSQGSRPVSQSSLHGSLSGGDHQSINQLDDLHISDVGALNAPLLSRTLASDKRQLSDVTEESLTGSKETVGGLTPPGPISQQNSTASDTDPVPGGADTEPRPGVVDTEPGPGNIEVVWEKQEPISSSPRRKRSQLSLNETKLTDDEASSEQTSLLNEHKIGELYTGTPERKKPLSGQRSSVPNERSSRDSEAGHFDDSVRSAPARMSAKRRPLVKANPVEV